MERQMAGLATVLRDCGNEVSVLTYRPEPDFFGKDLEAGGIRRITMLKKCHETTLAFEKRLADFFRESKPDVVIAYGQAASRKASIAHLFWPGFKLIVSERTANPVLNVFDLYKSVLYKKSADLLVTNSHTQKELLTKAFRWLKDMTVTVPNFIDAELFHPADSGKKRERFTIVTTSRVSPRKNTLRYIRAVRKAVDGGADVTVRWYGRRPDSRRYCAECDALIEKLDLKERFLLLDSTSEPEKTYREADAFCLPSHYEGTSNSLAEAMASGLPVICSDEGDNKIYVRPGENGYLFNSKDVDSIAEAIVKIASSPNSELESMGESSRKTVTEKLSLSTFRNRMENILLSL